jgi:sugar phosphate isomerase/epimerase
MRAIRLAHKHGYDAVVPDASFVADLTEDSRRQLLDDMRDKKLVWGAAGLPVSFGGDDARFDDGLKRLPHLAAALQKVGATRIGTAIGSSSSQLTYLANFRRTATRIRACAKILADHNLRLGLEYLGPKTMWASRRHSFVHSMAETKELIAEVGADNVGFILDSWHWYTAHETAADILTLENKDIVACDLNDAPLNIPVDEQIDSRRELPAATGVINLKDFLGALLAIGYDGPLRAEPFNRTVDQMDDDAACAETAKAMRRAFKLVGA